MAGSWNVNNGRRAGKSIRWIAETLRSQKHLSQGGSQNLDNKGQLGITEKMEDLGKHLPMEIALSSSGQAQKGIEKIRDLTDINTNPH